MALPDTGKFKKIGAILAENRDRLIVVLLMLVLGLFVLKIVNLSNIDYLNVIQDYLDPGKKGGTRVTKKSLNYEEIATKTLEERSIEDYVPLIQNDIFKPPDIRLEKKRRAQDNYDLGQKFFEEGKYARAISHFELVLKEDPQRAIIRYPIDPLEFLQKAKIASERKKILDLKKDADDAYNEADTMDLTGQEAKQEARNLYQKAIQNYKNVMELDPNQELVEKSVLDSAGQKMNEAQEKLKKLIEETFREEIQTLYQQGLDYWNNRESDPLKITKARQEWQTALDKISEIDPTHEIVDTETLDRIQKALDNVQIEITAKIPSYYSKGMESFTQGTAENDLSKLEQSKKIFEITYEFNPDYKDIKDRLNEVRKAYSKLKEETEIARSNEIISELNNLLKNAEQYISNNDADSLQDTKKQAVTLLREIKGLETTKIANLKSEAQKISGEIDNLKPKPLIEGYELKKIIPFGTTTHFVRLLEIATKKEITLRTDSSRSISGLKVLEVGPNYVIIEDIKQEKRPTQLFLSE